MYKKKSIKEKFNRIIIKNFHRLHIVCGIILLNVITKK